MSRRDDLSLGICLAERPSPHQLLAAALAAQSPAIGTPHRFRMLFIPVLIFAGDWHEEVAILGVPSKNSINLDRYSLQII